MDTSDETNDLVGRLLKSNINPSNATSDTGDAKEENNFNLTQEQFELLANVTYLNLS